MFCRLGSSIKLLHYDASDGKTEQRWHCIPHLPKGSVHCACERETIRKGLETCGFAHGDGPALRAIIVDSQTVLLWGTSSTRHAGEMAALRGALGYSAFGRDLFVEGAKRNVSAVLEGAQMLLEEFAYYRRSGIKHSLHTARYTIPKGMPGIVVLDATAGLNMTYELLANGGGVMVADIPHGIRNYRNVTLHVARSAAGMGNTAMKKKHHTRLPHLVKALGDEIEKGRKVFLCVHKCAEEEAARLSTDAMPLSVGHWGAVDGSNEWAGCDVAVIFGLFWQDPTRPINNVFAIDGPKDASWLKSPRHGEHDNILATTAQKDVSTSVVQAINRICIRRVVDQDGGCAPGDVYIVLPKDWRGDAILQDIHANMPGLNQVAWDFEPDGPKAYTPRPASAANAVIEFMRTRGPGITPLPDIKAALLMSPKQYSRLKENLADAGSKLAAALRGIGVFYQVEGKGRTTKAFLVKAA